ncbi:MAG TPA: peptidoglycan DD-metalloendopeptidase family protein [Rhodocyclaceae bacterium]|nr:peptidoglycan DD-metalloendopeptidase family protein [Rhodocyclaceae bacterium]
MRFRSRLQNTPLASISLLLLSTTLFVGCANYQAVSVVDRDNAATNVKPGGENTPPELRPGDYLVKKGDTLYGIALDHGIDYRDIAVWNALENPNLIKIGQILRLTPEPSPDKSGATATPVGLASPVAVAKPVILTGADIKPTVSPPPATTPAALPPVAPQTAANTSTAPAPSTAAPASLLKREPKGGRIPWSEETLARARQTESKLAAAKIEPGVGDAKPEAKPDGKLAAKPSDKTADKPAATTGTTAAGTGTVSPPPATGGDTVDFIWPTNGKLLATFAEGSSKGVDIAGKNGEPVLAAANGIVSYAGAGLRGYGNLVVLRHNATYLSVYAHNSKIVVKEKQTVAKGQKIAEIGSTDTDSPRLHFEIRRQGKPVDPLKFLPTN